MRNNLLGENLLRTICSTVLTFRDIKRRVTFERLCLKEEQLARVIH